MPVHGFMSAITNWKDNTSAEQFSAFRFTYMNLLPFKMEVVSYLQNHKLHYNNVRPFAPNEDQ